MKKEGLYLVLGSIVGGFVGWFMTRTYYKKEIQEIREAHAEMDKKKETSQNDAEEIAIDIINEVGEGYTVSKEDLHEYAELLRKQGYTSSTEKTSSEGKIYTIPPDEFGEDDNYETLSFTYYADGVLTDDNDDPVTNIAEIIGDALNHIGEWEPDAVYVRNEKLGLEYEILRDERNYAEVEAEKPRPVEIKHDEDAD